MEIAVDAAVTTSEKASRAAGVVVGCTPWQGAREAVRACGDLAGKPLIDCTNPLSPMSAHLLSATTGLLGCCSGVLVQTGCVLEDSGGV
jgi:predicted dinucleotide-binding enzyme